MSSTSKTPPSQRTIVFGEPLLSAEVSRAFSDAFKTSSEVWQVKSLAMAQTQKLTGETVVVIGAPASALGAMLQAGVRPQTALQAWTDAARRLSADLNTTKGKISLLVLGHDKGRTAAISESQSVIGPMVSGFPDNHTAPWMILAALSLINADTTACTLANALMHHAGFDGLSDLPTIESTISASQDVFCKDMQSDVTDPRQRMLQAEARLALSIETIDRMRAMLTEQLDDVTQYMQSKAALQEELSKLRMQLTDQYLIKSQVAAIQQQIRDVQETQRLRETVLGTQILRDGDFMHDAEILRSTLDKVYNSTSWKATAPLRWLRRKLSFNAMG